MKLDRVINLMEGLILWLAIESKIHWVKFIASIKKEKVCEDEKDYGLPNYTNS